MARGWESKTVESQIETAREDAARRPRLGLSLAEAELARKREGLLLSRIRVQRDLANARNEGYRRILRISLAKLEADLAALPDS